MVNEHGNGCGTVLPIADHRSAACLLASLTLAVAIAGCGIGTSTSSTDGSSDSTGGRPPVSPPGFVDVSSPDGGPPVQAVPMNAAADFGPDKNIGAAPPERPLRGGRRDEEDDEPAVPAGPTVAGGPNANPAGLQAAGGANPANFAPNGPADFRSERPAVPPGFNPAQDGKAILGPGESAADQYQPGVQPPVQPAVGSGNAIRFGREDDDERGPVGLPPGGGPAVLAGEKGAIPFGRNYEDSAGAQAGAGPGGTVTVKQDTPLDVITSFLDLVVADDLETAGTLVGPRATGLLARIREGSTTDADADELEELRTVARGRTQIGRERNRGRTLQYSFRGGNRVIVIEADQKDDGCSVTSLELRNAPRARRP